MRWNAIAGIVLAACTMPALAGSCPTLMHDVDEALADDTIVAELGESELQKVRELRARGEELHQTGSHGKSVKVLREALSILGTGGDAGGSGYY